jgi:tetratricopeptide (TPR) repeat protein
MDNYSKALEYYERALSIYLKTLGEDHSTTAATYVDIGYAKCEMGNYSKALEYYERALSI